MIAGALFLTAGHVPATFDVCPQFHPTITLSVRGNRLNAEVATTHSAHRCGLAKRKQLDSDRAMLFVYRDERIRRFWMKDTRIPLSLAFIGNDKRIQQIAQMQPQTPNRRYVSQRPARYVLETNLGWFAANGIRIGDAITFSLTDTN
jgi:hypothetical protein